MSRAGVDRGRIRASAAAAAFFAAPYLPFLGGDVSERSLPGAIAVGFAGVFAPGAAFVAHPGSREAPFAALRFLLGAALLNLAAILVRWVLDVPASSAAYAAILGSLTVATGAAGVLRGGERFRAHRPTAFVGAAAFALAVGAGMRVVPPLEDQDMEVQGTAYGLVHDLEPLCLTNRGTLHFLAHPPLLHLFNASTLTLANQLETVRPARDAALREAERLPIEGRRPSLARTLRAITAPEPRPDRTLAWTRDVYGPFLRSPALLGTRAPNFVLAAALAMLLFAALRRLGAGSADAALLTLTQATLPEVFVRSGYGGYFAISTVTFLTAAWLAARGSAAAFPGAAPRAAAGATPGTARAAFAAGLLAMLANHKSVVLGAASLVLGTRRARPLLVGLAAGALLFAVYGLAAAPEEFVSDHLLDHGLSRFRGDHAGASIYPSRAGLWLEFGRNYGAVWCLAVAAAFAAAFAGAAARLVSRRTGAGRAACLDAVASSPPGSPSPAAAPPHTGAAPEAEALVTLAAAWIAVGALVFTATDWRQTKHLGKLVPAMTLVLGAFLVRAPRPLRLALRGALAVSIVANAVGIVRLVRDFGSLRVTPLW